MRRILLACAFPFSLFALEEAPWYTEAYQLNFIPSYTYSQYSKVQGAHPNLSSTSHDQLLALNLFAALSDSFDAGVEAEFADTPRQSWGGRSAAAQVRYLFLDDNAGDRISLDMGGSMRLVTDHSLKDVSCPYHADVNFEINGALGGQMISCDWKRWTVRSFAFVGVGIANRGSAWLRGTLKMTANVCNRHLWSLFALGYRGYGHRKTIDVNHFNGYGPYAHRSIDLGVGYGYRFDFGSTLFLDYAHRIFARTFPENVNFFMVRFEIPFSMF